MKQYVLLMSRNIVNESDIKDWIEDIIENNDIKDKRIISWLNKQLVQYLKNDYPQVEKIREGYLADKKDIPSWVEKGIKEGTLVEVILNDRLTGEVDNIMDYFSQLSDNELDKIYKIPYDVACTKYKEWLSMLHLNALKNNANNADDNGEYVMPVDLPNGMKWVKLLTPEALDREGDPENMDHCIGKGDFDALLLKKKISVYSLRDSDNKSHCTIEVLKNNKIAQIKGYKDGPVEQKYVPYVEEFIHNPFYGKPYKDIQDLDLIGYKKINGQMINIYTIPENSTFEGNLDLDDTKIEKLPNNLTIKGSLSIESTPLKILPKNLVIENSLYAQCSKLTKLPPDISVGKNIVVDDTSITKLPDNLTVHGTLSVGGCKIKKLPKGLVVNLGLNASNTPLSTLPSDLIVKQNDIDLIHSKITHLPDNLKLNCDLTLDYCPIKELPNGLSVRYLSISKTYITILPQDLKAETVEMNNKLKGIIKPEGVKELKFT